MMAPAWRSTPARDVLDLLGRAEQLAERQRVDVAEHRRSGRQQRRAQEVRVEAVVAHAPGIHVLAALERAGGLAAGEQADDRSLVENRPAAGVPVLDIPQEVTDAAVGAED